jgi:hypothetical protein
MGLLEMAWEPATCLAAADWLHALRQLAAAADDTGLWLVQAHLDVRGLQLAAGLEEVGFRLVDTRMIFITRIDRRVAPRVESEVGTVALADDTDLPDLLRITHHQLAANPSFYSRYKNRDYFSPEESERWFAAWTRNDIGDPKARTAVWRVEGRLVGFFGQRRWGEYEDLPFYKGTLTAIEPAWRGRQGHLMMQSFVYCQLPVDEFYVENATQLTNAPVFYNHVKARRRLDRVELTYFRCPLGRPA